jgi:hypothetical protein
MNLKRTFAGLAVVMLLLVPVVTTHAAHLCTDGDGNINEVPDGIPCAPPAARVNDYTLYAVMNRVISIVFYVLMLFAVLMILVAAFTYLTARGDSEKVEKAKSAILYAVIAVAVGVLARSIPYVVSQFVVGNIL